MSHVRFQSPLDKRTNIAQTGQTDAEPKSRLESAELLANAVDACASRIGRHQRRIADQNQIPIDYLMEEKDSDGSESADNVEGLRRAITELQVLVSTRERSRGPWRRVLILEIP